MVHGTRSKGKHGKMQKTDTKPTETETKAVPPQETQSPVSVFDKRLGDLNKEDSDDEVLDSRKSKKIKGNPKSGNSSEEDWVVFNLTTGSEILSGKEEIQMFRDEWSDFILSSTNFSSKEEASNYIKNLKPSPPTTPIKSVVDLTSNDPAVPEASRTALSEAIASLHEKKPRNRIKLLYKTNSTSHACIIIIQCLNAEGKPQWNVKPDILSDPIKMFPEKFNTDATVIDVVNDYIIGNCFHHITHRVVRDLTGGPDTPMTVKWVSPDKSRTVNYDTYVLTTWFTIPVENINNKEEEDAFIKSKLITFAKSLKNVLTSNLFEKLHQANCPKEPIWNAINGTKKPGSVTFKDFIRDSTIEIGLCENLNRYVTKIESDALMSILWEGRGNGSPKYQSS